MSIMQEQDIRKLKRVHRLRKKVSHLSKVGDLFRAFLRTLHPINMSSGQTSYLLFSAHIG